MTLEIPVEPHVFEFLTSPEMYGSTLPIKARKDTLVGQVVIMLALKDAIDLEDAYHERILPVIPKQLVMLPVETTFPIKAELIQDENLMYACQLLSSMFEQQVILYALGHMARGGSERGAIYKFYQHFGMVDDPIKQEALRGVSKRYRKNIMVNDKKAVKKKPSRSSENVSKFREKLTQTLKNCPTQINALR